MKKKSRTSGHKTLKSISALLCSILILSPETEAMLHGKTLMISPKSGRIINRQESHLIANTPLGRYTHKIHMIDAECCDKICTDISKEQRDELFAEYKERVEQARKVYLTEIDKPTQIHHKELAIAKMKYDAIEMNLKLIYVDKKYRMNRAYKDAIRILNHKIKRAIQAYNKALDKESTKSEHDRIIREYQDKKHKLDEQHAELKKANEKEYYESITPHRLMLEKAKNISQKKYYKAIGMIEENEAVKVSGRSSV